MQHTMPELEVQRLSKAFGAELTGLDLSLDLSSDTRRALNEALLAHQVLIFRGQHLSADDQVRLAETFGPVRLAEQDPNFPSDNPRAHYIANVGADGRPTQVHPDPNSHYWHSDGSWAPRPARVTVLHATQVQGSVGDTVFANMYGVLDQLPPEARERLSKLRAIHDLELSRASRDRRWPWQWRPRRDAPQTLPSRLRWLIAVASSRIRNGYVVHPLVRCHPETGRRSLFVGDHAWRLQGMFWPLGIRRMQEINAVEIDPANLYSHHWLSGDLLVWDNRCVMHKAAHCDGSEGVRVMRRCVVTGEPREAK